MAEFERMSPFDVAVSHIMKVSNLEDLRTLHSLVAAQYKKISRTSTNLARDNFSLGQLVTFTGKYGVKYSGRITKMNRTRAKVKTVGSMWNVPYSMLKVA